MSDHVSARIAVLDKQIVDSDRLPVGRVDDLELRFPEDGSAPVAEFVLTGAEALGRRLGGGLGRVMAGPAARLRDEPHGPARIEVRLIEKLEPMIELRVKLAELPGVAGLERWLGRHVIGKLPGSGHAID